MKKNKNGILKGIFVFVILLIVIAPPFFKDIKFQKYHQDEPYWLRSSSFFKLFLIDKDTKNLEWSVFHAIDQPSIGKYIIGLGIFISGQSDKLTNIIHSKHWNFKKDYYWNSVNVMPAFNDVILPSRMIIAIFGISTCLLFYLIGHKIFSPSTGITAALLLAYNPLMLACGRTARSDAPLAFFLTANILLMIYFYQALVKRNQPRIIIILTLLGINIGLAVGTKFNGGITWLVFTLFCFLFIFLKLLFSKYSKLDETREKVKILSSSIIISALIALIVFILSNPLLHYQPIKNIFRMVNHRNSVIKIQQKQCAKTLTSLDQRFDKVVTRTLKTKNFVVLSNIFKIPLDLILFILGFIILIYSEIKYILKNHKPSLKTIIVLWVVVTFTAITILIPIDWSRYYLPVVLCVVMVVSYGLNKIIKLCLLIIKKASLVFYNKF